MSVKELKPAKVLHIRIKDNGTVQEAMEIIREFKDRVCHAIDYKRTGRYLILMHERDECCKFCETVEDYSSYLI